jgi:YD repeat-containing protein
MERFVDPFHGSATYSYDSGGNLIGLHLAPNDRITYSYDPVDRLEVTVNATGRRTTISYDSAGRRSLIRYGNQTRTSIVYDAADRITSQWDVKSDNSVVIGLDYQNDPVGNRTSMREATGRRTTWTYDDSYQLVNENRSSASGGFHTTFIYDPVGNRLVKNEAGALTTSTYDAANQLVTSIAAAGTTTFTFDAAGNQQIEQAPSGFTTNVWDCENQRTQVLLPSGQRETITYNADYRMKRRTV